MLIRGKTYAFMGTLTSASRLVRSFSVPIGPDLSEWWPLNAERMELLREEVLSCDCYGTKDIQIVTIQLWQRDEDSKTWYPAINILF